MFKRVFSKDGQPVESRRSSYMPEFVPTDKINLNPCKLSDFNIGPILGTGSFGRVPLGTHKSTGKVCAIKQLSKSQILKTKQVQHIKAEKAILEQMNFPFLVAMYGYFQDPECVYLVLEYIVGGEFFTHLRSAGRFSEDASRFYSAEVVLSFEYLHGNDIVYRDLKPENILLDSEGHLKVTDFGFAKQIEHRTYTLCGTPDYLAPEIILNKGHGKPVDWWALGVLCYEMLAGYPPFYDDDPMGTYQRILHGKLEFPSHFSRASRDLVKKLLQSDLSKRYGNLKGGAKDIKAHPWYQNMDFTALVNKRVSAPIKPIVKGEDDTSNFDDYSDVGPIEHEFVLTADNQQLFEDF